MKSVFPEVSRINPYLGSECPGNGRGEQSMTLRTHLLEEGDITGADQNKQTKAS